MLQIAEILLTDTQLCRERFARQFVVRAELREHVGKGLRIVGHVPHFFSGRQLRNRRAFA